MPKPETNIPSSRRDSGFFPRQLPDTSSWQPVILDASSAADRLKLRALLDGQPTISCADTIEQQLRDYARTLLKDKQVAEEFVLLKVQDLLAGVDPEEFGNWVYYPWRGQVARLLPKGMFRELRLDRNRHRITDAEQSVLLDKSIGIVGLSVGVAGLTTMVLEGVGGKFRIADFDALDLSNLNRLRASVLDVGVNKAVLAARAILEIDPYLEVQLFPEGVNVSNIDAFFAPPLDLLVEECDDLPMKVRLREHARAAHIPVLMETTDRGMLDVERFDLEPQRPILHGRVGQVNADSLEHASYRDKVPFVLAILDEQRISTRLAASLVEIEKTVYTWPQLASAVALGGALLSYAARNLLLGLHRFSGRLYVDFDRLVSQELLYAKADVAAATDAATPAQPDAWSVCEPLPSAAAGTLTAAEARFLVEHAVCAPSGGNTQPWHFRYRAGEIECRRVAERADTFLDFGGWASKLAMGAAVENVCIAAGCLGYQVTVAQPAEPDGPLARLGFVPGARAVDTGLRKAIFDRVSHRHRLQQPPIRADLGDALEAEAQDLGLHLVLIRDLPGLRALGVVLGAADRLRYQIQSYHEELMRELRWSPAEANQDRTGIDIATLEASAADLAGLHVVRRWDVMQFLQQQQLGESLEDGARKSFVACAGAGLLSAPNSMSPFEAGRRLQRLWLSATRRGLAWHPWVAVLAMYARALAGDGLSSKEQRSITTVGQRLLGLWNPPLGNAPIFVFRILESPPAPTARSVRLPLEAVFDPGS